ncbi:MAG: hypothetical protein L3K23_10500 [Thermoplasmata archaeon]|nr:hypothetical protein [Thermoplasmata archaeon]
MNPYVQAAMNPSLVGGGSVDAGVTLKRMSLKERIFGFPSRKLKTKNRPSAALFVALSMSLLSTGRLHGSRRAASSMGQAVGFGLAITGGILAFGAAIGLLFVPVATFTTLDAELFLLFGAILFGVGIAVDRLAQHV